MDRSKRARIGFIGAGWWATSNHMPVLASREDVELSGVCRLGAKELDRVKKHFGFSYGTESFRDLITNCELDGIIISSPHPLHYEHAKLALEAGIPVMCEKPLATRADHARELVAIAQKNKLPLLVPYGWHHKSFIKKAKKILDERGVGKIEFVMCHMASPIRDLLAGIETNSVDISKKSGQNSSGLFGPTAATWADPQISGGGYAHAQISHSSGLLFWLTDLQAESVFAEMSAPGSKVDLYDALTVRFRSGAIGTISGAGNVPKDKRFQVDLRIFGSEGMILIDCERARMCLNRHDGKDVNLDVSEDAGSYECDGPPNNFVDLILGKTEVNLTPGESAMRGVEMIDAAYRSSKSGKSELVC
mgnify:CR=1 FL=1